MMTQRLESGQIHLSECIQRPNPELSLTAHGLSMCLCIHMFYGHSMVHGHYKNHVVDTK